MSRKKAIIITTILTLIIGIIAFYLLLPALNIKSEGFWLFIMGIVGLSSFILVVLYSIVGYDFKKVTAGSSTILILLVSVLLIGQASSAVIFRAKSYAKLMHSHITEHDFEDYNATIENVPLMDKDSAMKIANRKLGELEDVISQYEIDDTEQITVRGEPIRVACLNHAGFIKWLSNRHSGTPGFIKVDMNTQEAELVRVDGGIKYTKSDFFGRDLTRYLRMNYPTKIFWETTLELDEKEHPYWVTATLDKTIGLFGGTEVSGAVLIDAVTGEHALYSLEDIPEWVDNVYGSSLLLDQFDKYGMYQNGFLNSIIGQKGVRRTTEGYNYIPQGNDNWIYTGITSVGKDESNIGFILVNKRTKETHYYGVSGAEEFSAMNSAEGAVQHLGYRSTFPLLLKIGGQPTYLVSLKDSGGLVKMYAMVNVAKYQIVATGSNISETLSQYSKLLKDSGINVSGLGSKSISGIIEDIKMATVEGNSNYFIKLKGDASYYLLDIRDNKRAGILSLGDHIILNLEVIDNGSDIVPAQLQDGDGF
ncbi:MAG: CvpA family protein [Clostridiales bacterium]|nr:CvpA family protein [Clostridiales bacterium]